MFFLPGRPGFFLNGCYSRFAYIFTAPTKYLYDLIEKHE